METSEFDIADYLDSNEMIAEYLNTVLAQGNESDVITAIGHVAKLIGMTKIAQETGLSRPYLFKALSDGAKPQFETIMKVLRAIGGQIKINPIHKDKRTKTMYQRIAHIALVVDDYDDAIEFYTQKLDFQLLEDTKLNDGKRWVMVAPKGAKECCLLLAKAANERQTRCIGNQTGGRIGFFLFTDDFWRDYNKMIDRQINFVRAPATFEYGTVAVFEDLYGNMWDLIEPNENNKGLINSPNQRISSKN